jgi:hypothetical protein
MEEILLVPGKKEKISVFLLNCLISQTREIELYYGKKFPLKMKLIARVWLKNPNLRIEVDFQDSIEMLGKI